MWIASYLIDTNGLRIENLSSGVQQAFFSNDLFEGSKQVDRLKSRSESVTKDHFFDYLVVVLDDKFTLDEIRAVVEVCKSKSKKCRVISPLLARLNFAVSMLPQPLNLYDHLIVITLTGHLCDIHVLCKSDNQIIFIRENLLDHNDPEVFKIVKLYLQRKIVLIHDESNRYLTFPLVKEFPEVTMFEFENWNSVLIEGGLQKARSQINPKEFESIKDFLPGFSCQTYDQSIVLCTMGRPLTTTNVRKTLAVGEKLEIKQGIQLTVNDEKFERFSQAVKTLDCTPGKYDFNFEFIVDGSDCVEFKISKQPCQDVIVKKPPNQFGFLVYHMFSTNLCFSENINKSTFFKLTPPLSKDASIPQKLGEKNCQALFNGLPKNAAVKSSVLVHSGDFSKSLVEQAYEKAKKLTSKVVIISEIMAQLQNAALYLPEMNEGENLTIIFFMGSFAMIYFLKYKNKKLHLYDDAMYPSNNLAKIKNVTISTHRSDLVLIISDILTKEIRKTFDSERVLEKKYVEVENFGRTVYTGALAKAAALTEPNPEFPVIVDFCDTLTCKMGNELHSLTKEKYHALPMTVEKILDVSPTNRSIEILQKKSIIGSKQFLIYKLDRIPDTWKQCKIVLSVALDGTFQVSITQFPTDKLRDGIPETPTTTPSLASISSKPATEKVIPPCADAIYYLETCNGICIRLVKETGLCSVELLEKGNYIRIGNANGSIPTFISFVDEIPKIGHAAVEDYKNNPGFVVQDILTIIGKKWEEIYFFDRWNFQICKSGKVNDWLIAVETANGPKCFSPSQIISLFLKALCRFAQDETGGKFENVYFIVSPSFNRNQTQVLKDACEIAKLRCLGTTQYSPRNTS